MADASFSFFQTKIYQIISCDIGWFGVECLQNLYKDSREVKYFNNSSISCIGI